MPDHSMQAIRIHEYGGPEQLVLETLPCPEPKGNEVLVRILSAGVNPTDWKYRSGAMKQYIPLTLPWTPGVDAAGIVEAVGPEVTTLRVGQAVYGRPNATYAEYTVAPEGELAPKPKNLTYNEAAAVPVGALTAWKSLFDVANLQLRQRVLVQGAAGGVGLFAIQLAHWKGAYVIGAASGANVDLVRALGADQAIDYRNAPVETIVNDVDVVIDTVGGEITDRSLHALRRGGILVTVANQAPEARAESLGVRAVRGGRAGTDLLPQITVLIEAGTIRPIVGTIYSLEEAAKAQAESQTGHGRGRIILHIADQ
ncbi:MAG TPA: NADP-dependent oxidoreductase [Anaerolineaceae bacterium]|jgi:NADPH:quinone reductase-like Zn-dependent oxidoreductase